MKTRATKKACIRTYVRVISVFVWIVLWQLAAMKLSKELFLPTPISVWRVLWGELFPSKDFWLCIRTSLLHIGMGFLLGSFCGIFLAALSNLCKPIQVLLWFPIKLIKAVPVASFVILALLWVPSSGLSVIIPFLMVLPTLYIHTLTGIQETDGQLLTMAQVFRIPRWEKCLHIYIPQVLPYVSSACSLAIGMAWKSGIAAEIIGLSRGSIGNQLYQAKIYLMTPQLFAWTIVIVTLSIACEWLIKGITHLCKALAELY